MGSRENIIASARELFTTKGYAETSPRDIMDRANVGQGSFYHYFRSKSQLAREVLTAVSDDLLGVGMELLSQDKAPMERIQAYLEADRDALRGCRLGRFAYDAALEEAELREPTAKYFREIEVILIDAFQHAINTGRLAKELDSRNLATTTLAVVQGGYILARIHGDAAYLSRAINGLWSILSNQV